MRESIELVHTAEYANFLRVFFPPFVKLLGTLPPSFTDNADHKLRNMLLEVLNRCDPPSAAATLQACSDAAFGTPRQAWRAAVLLQVRRMPALALHAAQRGSAWGLLHGRLWQAWETDDC